MSGGGMAGKDGTGASHEHGPHNNGTHGHGTHEHGSHDHRTHDHEGCVDAALDRARALCASRQARLTPVRERVLALVWSSHRPRGAYAILEDLAADGRRVAPLTIYRALDFLLEQGLVHRIESLNAYVGCPHPDQRHSGQFLVCQRCGDATELDDPAVTNAIAAGAAAKGFVPQRQMVEVLGLCPCCQTP